ncbi:MAG: PAS domain S-box protein [Clostridiales bacterium]|nr:PAS domain S-box protein [Clostridiales bacterium]
MLDNFSAEQARYFFEKSDDGICVISTSGELLMANPVAEKILGISASDHLKIWKSIPYVEENDDLIQMFIDTVTSKLQSHEAIVDYVNNEGKKHNLHIRLTYYKEELAAYLLVITDLTKLIRTEAAFARYTSPDIADYVLTTSEGQKRGGVSQEVTVLLSDLRGFTAISASLPPQDLIDLLNHYFEQMVAIIERYGGTVIEFLGDGIFVLFGAPKDLPDHASRAVRCAIEMQNCMQEVNAWNQENGYPNLEMGIGINSGTVVVGNIGSEKKMKYGCVGAAVNLTGRLESLTIGGQILVSENTKKLIPESFEYISEDSFFPKGGINAVSYYEVTGIGDDLFIRRKEEEISWKSTSEVSCLLFLLEGKTVIEQEHSCTIIKRSEDGRYALIEADLELAERTNIMLKENGDRKYAKVLRKEDGGFLICFTFGN